MDESIVAAFHEWLKTKDPDETYVYSDCNNCCVARFLKETGRAKKPIVSPSEYTDKAAALPEVWIEYPYIMDRAAQSQADGDKRTFGEALIELEKALIDD